MEGVSKQKNRSRSRRVLLPGESTIASTGLLLAVIVLCTMGGSAWWSAQVQQRALGEARRESLDTAGTLLAELSGALLAGERISRVRLLVAEAARVHDLDDARIVLPEGEVIAAVRASDITLAVLPDAWSELPVDEAQIPTLGGAVDLSFPIAVDGRGGARLDLTTAPRSAAWSPWNTQAGIGLIGAVALFATLLVYRRMRARMRALNYIRESLLALDAGESSLAALTVNADLGTEAVAWNELLAERENLQQVLVTKRLLELPSARSDRNQDLTSMCDAMAQGLILVDRNLLINYANGAAGLYLGTSREEILGTSIEQQLGATDILETVRGVASGVLRRSTSSEVKREGADAVGVLRFCVRPVRRDDESAAMVVIEDVTQQRLADASRNTFVAQITHELRTPLTNILLWAESAMEESEHDIRDLTRSLNVITQEAKRLDRVVNDMLSVSELEAGAHSLRTDDVSLTTLFEELREDYRAAAREKNIALTFNLPPKLPVIQGDRDKISLAVHNLLGNAMKYTPERGHIVVDVECEGGKIVVKVIDDGIGIKESDLERVFEKFYRAEDQRVTDSTGTGLGLALAREVIRLHGGEISVESAIDKGSTFVLTVPAPVTAA